MKYQNTHGQSAGELSEGVFRKVVLNSKHRYKELDGWGIDAAILKELPKGTEIRIKDREDGTVYITTLERFMTGSLREWGDHGEQIVFWQGFFDQIKGGERIPSPYIESWDAQMELWNSV